MLINQRSHPTSSAVKVELSKAEATSTPFFGKLSYAKSVKLFLGNPWHFLM